MDNITDRKKRQLEIVSKLNIIDDTMFHKMAEDSGVCEEIICTILEDETIKVCSNEPQMSLRNTGSRSVILDVLCEDADGHFMNIEVQKADDDDHQRRVRYNRSNIDTYMTEKGLKFKEIPDVYVIYISRSDFFQEKRTIYHIERRIQETGTLVDNGFHEVYVNAEIHDGSRIANLMQYMNHTTGQQAEFPRVSARVKYFKEEQKGVETMCELVEQYAQEAEQRVKEVAKEAAMETARMFLLNGASYEMAQKSVKNLTKEELAVIYAEVKEELGKREHQSTVSDNRTLKPRRKPQR